MSLSPESDIVAFGVDSRDVMANYRHIVRRRAIMLLLLTLLIVASLLLDFVMGPSGLSLQALWQTLTDPASASAGTRAIVWDIRMPYALMAIVVGLALGLAGAEMQTILNNPLASPFTLGVSSAAAFGAALAIVLGIGIPGVPGQWFVSANAFIFALLAALLLDGITRWTQVATSGVILFGIALVFTFNALVSMLQFVANEDTLQGLVFWTMGSIDRASWQKVGILLAILAVVMPLSMRSAWKLTALRVEADRAAPRRGPGRQLRHQRAPPAPDHPAAHQRSVGDFGGVRWPNRFYRPGGAAYRQAGFRRRSPLLPAGQRVNRRPRPVAGFGCGKKPDSRRSDSGGYRHLAGGGAFFPEHHFAPSGTRMSHVVSGLALTHFSAGYPRRQVIRDLTVPRLQRGKITALLGPNGSGKSTLMRAMAGLGPSAGELSLDGENLLALPFARRAEKVVYLPQTLPAGVHLRVLESIIVAQRAAGGAHSPENQAQVMSLLRQLGIEHLALSYLDRLSGGQKQLVGLAQSLIRQPALLLLDEPLSALDLNYQFHVMDLVREETQRRNIITLVVVHDINIALRHADHVLMLKEGQLLGDGAPAEVITPQALAAVYGVRGRIEPCSQGVMQVIIDGLAAGA